MWIKDGGKLFAKYWKSFLIFIKILKQDQFITQFE